MIVQDDVIDPSKVWIGDGTLPVTGRFEHLRPKFSHERSKTFVLGHVDANRKYFGEKTDRFLKAFGSAIMERDTDSIALVVIETVKVGD
jgi:hypothetical protein